MNGILLVDKPADWTSFDVVAKLRGATRQKKLGHGGTLDPMATGLLPVFFGRATRLTDLLPDHTKRYEAELQLGLETDTYDTTGTVLRRRPVSVTPEALNAVAARFKGPITQLPPMYSSVKVDGRRLYELARQGKEIERPPRQVHIYSLDCRLVSPDRVALSIFCSRGTYVRSLCHDMGAMLGCGGAMSALRRTASSGFVLEDALPLDRAVELARQGSLEAHLLPIWAAFSALPRIDVKPKEARLMRHGVRLEADRLGAAAGQTYQLWAAEGFMGIGAINDEGQFVFRNLCPS